MTLMEAINAVDSLVQNVYTYGEKVAWLSALDGIIKTEIIDCHKGADGVDFAGYDDNTAGETVLLVPEPYSRDLYMKYLQNQMDYYNGETARYNNSLRAYQAAYTAFARWYNRTHQPLSRKRKYW